MLPAARASPSELGIEAKSLGAPDRGAASGGIERDERAVRIEAQLDDRGLVVRRDRDRSLGARRGDENTVAPFDLRERTSAHIRALDHFHVVSHAG